MRPTRSQKSVFSGLLRALLPDPTPQSTVHTAGEMARARFLMLKPDRIFDDLGLGTVGARASHHCAFAITRSFQDLDA